MKNFIQVMAGGELGFLVKFIFLKIRHPKYLVLIWQFDA